MIKELLINDIDKYIFLNIEKQEIMDCFKNNPFCHYIIYYENNKVYGYLYYSDIYDRAEINQFEVNEECRNKGIGNKLISYFVNLLNKNVTLEVKIDNYNAIHLYKKYGFKEVSIRKGYYKGIDGLLMERSVK